SEHHHRPAGLAVPDHARFAVRVWMQRDDLFEKFCFSAANIFDGLTGDRLGEKADEIAGMARCKGNADPAVGLQSSDTRTVPGARVDDDERAPFRIDSDSCGWDTAHERVIDRSLELSAVDD